MEEFDSSSPPVSSVSTSTMGFVGVTEKGPDTGLPVLVTSAAAFRRVFGGELSEGEFEAYRYLAYAVNQFFVNGGTRCYIKRVVPKDATKACNVEDVASSPVVFYASNPGVWGNKITIAVKPSSKAKTQVLEKVEALGKEKYKLKNAAGFLPDDIVEVNNGSNLLYNKIESVDGNFVIFKAPFEENIIDTDILPKITISTAEIDIEVRAEGQSEVYEHCSFNQNSRYFIDVKLAKSELVTAKATAVNEIISPFKRISGKEDDVFYISLFGGQNGTPAAISSSDFVGEDNGPGNRSGIQSFIDNEEVSLMAVPGITEPGVALQLVAHCERLKNRFAILDFPNDLRTDTDIINYRNYFDSDYAALYHPWVKVLDPLTQNAIAIPPSGSIGGVYARTDNTRGVHKAPANEIVSACVGLMYNYTTGEQDVLNPKGVNLIRSFPGQGIRVWGARTASSNSLWRYINVRRLFIYIEESIKASTNWVVFEPNDQFLWIRVKRTIDMFLGDVWRSGALVGSSEAEAFFVDIGPNTMTQNDIDSGRLICVIGVAPVKPAEFVIFRITQKTNGAQ